VNVERTALEDPDLTPKASKPLPHTASAGAFLKSEFHKGSTESDASIHLSELNAQGERVSPPKIPERRLSKSKTFFFKVGSRKEKEPKPIPRFDSTTSKNTLVRRFSRGQDRNSVSDSAYSDSITSTDSSCSLDGMNSGDIANVIIDPRISSYHRGSVNSQGSESSQSWPAFAREDFILCPEITITPEVLSLDGGSTDLWVAVEVTGTLRLANSFEQISAKFQEERRNISGGNAGMLFFSFVGKPEQSFN
jgi:hypothetical protein